MEIIIEYVLIDNILINYMIFFLSFKILKQHMFFWRLIIASVVGACFALILPMIPLSWYMMIPLKLFIGFLMVLISFPYSKFKKMLTYFLVFILTTGMMGGVCFITIYMLSGSLSADTLTNYSFSMPVGVILFVCFIAAYLINSLIKMFYKKKRENNFIYEAVILNNGKKVKVNAFLDSGNTLIDPKSQKPVIIITYALFNKLYSLPIEQVLMKKINSDDIKNSHYISFNTVGSSGEMLVFEIEEMKIIMSKKQEKKIKNVLLGLSFSNLCKTFACDALLHPDYVYC